MFKILGILKLECEYNTFFSKKITVEITILFGFAYVVRERLTVPDAIFVATSRYTLLFNL